MIRSICGLVLSACLVGCESEPKDPNQRLLEQHQKTFDRMQLKLEKEQVEFSRTMSDEKSKQVYLQKLEDQRIARESKNEKAVVRPVEQPNSPPPQN